MHNNRLVLIPLVLATVLTRAYRIQTWSSDNAGSLYQCLAFSPDGEILATCTKERTVELWNVSSSLLDGGRIRQPQHVLTQGTGDQWAVAFHPQGRYLASILWRGETIGIWDLNPPGDDEQKGIPRLLYRLNAGGSWDINFLEYSQDGSLLLASHGLDSYVSLWDVANNYTLITKLLHNKTQVPERYEGATGVSMAAFVPTQRSSDAKLIVTATYQNSMAFWKVEEALLAARNNHTVYPWRTVMGFANDRYIEYISFRTNSSHMVTGDRGGNLKVWNIPNIDATSSREMRLRQLLFMDARDRTDGLTYTPDGRYILSAAGDSKLRLWEAETGRLVWAIDAHRRWMSGVAFSPKDPSLFATVGWEPSIVLWNFTQLHEMPCIEDERAPVCQKCSLCFIREEARENACRQDLVYCRQYCPTYCFGYYNPLRQGDTPNPGNGRDDCVIAPSSCRSCAPCHFNAFNESTCLATNTICGVFCPTECFSFVTTLSPSTEQTSMPTLAPTFSTMTPSTQPSRMIPVSSSPTSPVILPMPPTAAPSLAPTSSSPTSPSQEVFTDAPEEAGAGSSSALKTYQPSLLIVFTEKGLQILTAYYLSQ